MSMPEDIRGKLRLLILHLLSESPKHGYSLMKQLERIIGRVPSPGTIYPLLKDLLDSGLVGVSVRKREGKVIKTYYITEEGRKFLDDRREELEHVLKLVKSFTKFREIGGEKLLNALKELGSVLADLSDAEVEKIRNILSKCASEVMEILREVRKGKGSE
ncbi:MAG: PadR family transcriptional regulator [Desulfurococcales archaeon]|nr:PadR family transcriptional regulator [Desulfurococcales archaeon]